MPRLIALGTALLCSACAIDDADLATTTSDLDITKFVLPSLGDAERAQIVRQYDAIDPDNDVPRGLLEDALVYFHVNKTNIPKTQHLVVVDLSRYSGMD